MLSVSLVLDWCDWFLCHICTICAYGITAAIHGFWAQEDLNGKFGSVGDFDKTKAQWAVKTVGRKHLDQERQPCAGGQSRDTGYADRRMLDVGKWEGSLGNSLEASILTAASLFWRSQVTKRM